MNRKLKNPISRIVTGAAIAGAVLGTTLSTAPAAHAASPQAPKYFDRKAAVERAAEWTSKSVRYSQTAWRDDYRTDCSGLVSKAWNLDQSYVTWSLPEISKPIAKSELKPGDVMLNAWGNRKHVVLFGGWVDKAKTKYRSYEEVGAQYDRAVSRIVSYPYDSPSRANYKPYRYTGGHSLSAPANNLPGPLVQTYAGGKPMAAGPGAARTNAKRLKIAEKRKADAKARLVAGQRAEKAKTERRKAGKAVDRKAAAKAKSAERKSGGVREAQLSEIDGGLTRMILEQLGL